MTEKLQLRFRAHVPCFLAFVISDTMPCSTVNSFANSLSINDTSILSSICSVQLRVFYCFLLCTIKLKPLLLLLLLAIIRTSRSSFGGFLFLGGCVWKRKVTHLNASWLHAHGSCMPSLIVVHRKALYRVCDLCSSREPMKIETRLIAEEFDNIIYRITFS